MSYDEQKFSRLIYDILRESDLNTVSAKRIRNSLAEKLGYDINEHKAAINRLIEVCFDRVNAENANGTNDASASPSSPAPSSSPEKRNQPSDASDLSEVEDRKPPKKRVKTSPNAEESDAAYAARLQRELNSGARPTRAGTTRKAAPAKKKKKKKKKSAAKVKDNSDAESGSNVEPKEKKGGFHKPMNLSEPLSALLGENQLSRPQTVKKIWEYVKARDLQDPEDRRQIRCDDAMRAVFKTDRVHMFTMNKILNQNLYAVDE